MKKSVIEKAIGKLSMGGTDRGDQSARSAADQRRDVSGREAERPVFAVPPMQQRNREGSFHSLGTPGVTSEAVISLPRNLLQARGMLTPDTKRTRIAEEYRSIKRPLLMNIDKKGATIVDNANMIMVTSARPGDGKTFTAMNLAISLTMEPDRTVLLIDGDVAKPDAANQLGAKSKKGLIDLLTTPQMTLKDVILQTDVPNLRVVSAGSFHERATELLASAAMRNLMEEISGRYPDRVVIFDSPPLLRASEASVLANLMGQIVLVVAAGKTPQNSVTDALAMIEDDKIVGLVLNKFGGDIFTRYGYGYGYGYGSGQDRAQAPDSQKPQ